MHRTLRNAGLGLLALLGLASCNGGNSIDYLPVQTSKDAHWGMVGPDGKILFDEEFKEQPSIAINGVFTVKEGNGYSVYTAEKKPKLVGDLEGLVSVGCYSDGVIPAVRPGGRIVYYDKKGNEKFTLEPYNGKEWFGVASFFSDGLAEVENEDGYGAIDTDGHIVIQPKYTYLSAFADGVASARIDSVTYIIDSKGNEIAKLRGVDIYGIYHGGYFDGQKDDRPVLVDRKGQITKVPKRAKSILDFNEKYIIYKDDDGNYGVMTIGGESIIRPKYKVIRFFDADHFLCSTDNDKWYIIDTDDEREEIDDMKEVIAIRYNMKRRGFSTRFNLLGEDKRDSYLLDDEGEPLEGVDEFTAIGINMDWWVRSDYFDAEGAAKAVAAHVTANGFGKASVGAPLYKCFDGQPSDFVRVDKYYFPDLKSGLKYNLSGYAYTNSYVTTGTPVYTNNSYWPDHYDYVWNSDAMTDRIYVSLNISASGQYAKVKKALVDAIKAKGYAITEQTAAYTLMSHGNTRLFICPMSGTDNSSVELNFFTAAAWPNVADNLKRTATNMFDNMPAPGDSDDDVLDEAVEVVEEPYEEVIDTVAY